MFVINSFIGTVSEAKFVINDDMAANLASSFWFLA